ncbi:hypothetical protein KKF34_00030 [Myxococcota bacterium]|nr:hypothetical protein [Myxococcota bacterium]MBU1380571.1 hypothetical protein [Myxococcota bacterium]MBU1495247.1 hypothetical protein [Myxococcota bacterium]
MKQLLIISLFILSSCSPERAVLFETTINSVESRGDTVKAAIKCHGKFKGKYTNDRIFELKNSPGSLIAWSLTYQKKIDKMEIFNGDLNCEKVMSYRGSAHCQQVGNAQYRKLLTESIASCRKLLIKRKDNYCVDKKSDDCANAINDLNTFNSWINK